MTIGENSLIGNFYTSKKYLKNKMLIATLITSCALSIPWDPATSKTMNGQYGFANPLPGAGKKPTHRGTDYFEVTNFFVFFAQNLYLPSPSSVTPLFFQTDVIKETDLGGGYIDLTSLFSAVSCRSSPQVTFPPTHKSTGIRTRKLGSLTSDPQ